MNETVAYAVLDLARELIADGWTQGAYVRSGSGWAVPIDSRSVRRVCAAGALDRAGWALDVSFADRELVRAWLLTFLEIDGLDPCALERWNDEPGRTRDEVLALYDRALDRLRPVAA